MAEYKDLTSRKAVLAAIAECDHVGIDSFRERYGFEAAKRYVLRYGGGAYDSKAIVGVAYGFQFPEIGPLTSGGFSGGKTAAGRHLSRLGFEVDGLSPGTEDWTLAEVKAVVAIYFDAFQRHLASNYVRRDAIAEAEVRIPTRRRSAVERKLSNICAILKAVELPVLPGFGALGNKQTLLTAIVTDWLADHPEAFDLARSGPSSAPIVAAVEVAPPTGLTLNRTRRARRGCHVDFADRDARNRLLGQMGEAWAVEVLKAELREAGRGDLADRVIWASKTQGDGLGYDIASFRADGTPLAVEVKTTNGGVGAPFMVTANEVAASRGPLPFLLMRVFDLAGDARFYRLAGPIEDSCQLEPRAFTALPLTSSADL